MKREFYYQDDRSNKFWTIELKGNVCITTNGRIGAKPRETKVACNNAKDAKCECAKLIAAKQKKGYIEGKIKKAPHYVKPDWASMKMSEDAFWRIIGLFNWKRRGDDDAVIKPAVTALAQMSIKAIERFEDIMAEKLYVLDTKSHAKAIGEDSYGTDKYFSVDNFLYVRCVPVANGKEVYEEMLADPSKMPKDMDYEPLLWVAGNAYELKTGKPFKHQALVSYETYSNRAGWKQISNRHGKLRK